MNLHVFILSRFNEKNKNGCNECYPPRQRFWCACWHLFWMQYGYGYCVLSTMETCIRLWTGQFEFAIRIVGWLLICVNKRLQYGIINPTMEWNPIISTPSFGDGGFHVKCWWEILHFRHCDLSVVSIQTAKHCSYAWIQFLELRQQLIANSSMSWLTLAIGNRSIL